MKKNVREWIDKEIERLDREVEGEEPEKTVPDPVPAGVVSVRCCSH